uniref:Ig-like domain-containing protein n=1 Tax=Xiphophorus couchianus TaxID=32473 RepID=A0A3B5MX23_9TELE
MCKKNPSIHCLYLFVLAWPQGGRCNISWSLGVKCEQLTQPTSQTVQPGQSLTISCQVSYSPDDWYTAWIRQPAGKGLEWIGMECIGCTKYYKDSLKNKFSISLDGSSNTVTLNGQNMQPDDSAVYYCARATVTQTSSRAEQKLLTTSTPVLQLLTRGDTFRQLTSHI